MNQRELAAAKRALSRIHPPKQISANEVRGFFKKRGRPFKYATDKEREEAETKLARERRRKRQFHRPEQNIQSYLNLEGEEVFRVIFARRDFKFRSKELTSIEEARKLRDQLNKKHPKEHYIPTRWGNKTNN